MNQEQIQYKLKLPLPFEVKKTFGTVVLGFGVLGYMFFNINTITTKRSLDTSLKEEFYPRAVAYADADCNRILDTQEMRTFVDDLGVGSSRLAYTSEQLTDVVEKASGAVLKKYVELHEQNSRVLDYSACDYRQNL